MAVSHCIISFQNCWKYICDRVEDICSALHVLWRAEHCYGFSLMHLYLIQRFKTGFSIPILDLLKGVFTYNFNFAISSVLQSAFFKHYYGFTSTFNVHSSLGAIRIVFIGKNKPGAQLQILQNMIHLTKMAERCSPVNLKLCKLLKAVNNGSIVMFISPFDFILITHSFTPLE